MIKDVDFYIGNDIIQDLLKVSEADLFHQANMVDDDVKMIIQEQEQNTKYAQMSPLHRFATFANLPAHYDCDFAPKNAGVYFNNEYFQLYLAYRDLEAERQRQQADTNNNDPRPVMVQCRADIEKVLVNTNWEAIRRRLTIGERIFQVCGIVGRGFLLLSKQVSGRKLLHNFNTGEWTEFMREFQRPENQTLLQTLQTKYDPKRLYAATSSVTHHHQPTVVPAAAASSSTTPMGVMSLSSSSSEQQQQASSSSTTSSQQHQSASPMIQPNNDT